MTESKTKETDDTYLYCDVGYIKKQQQPLRIQKYMRIMLLLLLLLLHTIKIPFCDDDDGIKYYKHEVFFIYVTF